MVHGDELPDWDLGTPSRLVAPALMAAEFDLEYVTYAVQGASNELINRTIGTYLLRDYQPGDFLFIGWSSLFRKELYVPEMRQAINCIPNYFGLEKHAHLDKQLIDDIARVYKYYHDIIETIELETLVLNFAQTTNVLYNALENLQIPFLMVKMLSEYKNIADDLLDLMPRHPNFYLESDSMMQYLFGFEEKASLFRPGMHPNEEGQRRIKTLLMDYMRR